MTAKEEPLKGHIKIYSKSDKPEEFLSGHNIIVELDGKPMNLLQKVELSINAIGIPMLVLTMIPRTLSVDLPNIQVETKEGDKISDE